MTFKKFITLPSIRKLFMMVNNNQQVNDLSDKMRIGLAKARLKFLEQEAKEGGTVVIADDEGTISEVPAKDLLQDAQQAVQ
jgi:hypothetical protein